MSATTVNRERLRSLLLRGDKVAAVAVELGCTDGAVSQIAQCLGIQRAWTTVEERQLLAALRAMLCGAGSDPAESIALFEAVGRLLRTYQTATVEDRR